jgi:hypothetical protein
MGKDVVKVFALSRVGRCGTANRDDLVISCKARDLISKMCRENPCWVHHRSTVSCVHPAPFKVDRDGLLVKRVPRVWEFKKLGLYVYPVADLYHEDRAHLDSRRARQQVSLQQFAKRPKARFNPCRDSAGCTIVMRRPRRRKNWSLNTKGFFL